MFKRLLLAPLLVVPLTHAQTIFNCTSFSSSGTCGASQTTSTPFAIRNGGNLSGSVIDLVPANSGHNGYGVTYTGTNSAGQTENIQAFTETVNFVPNGQNFALVWQNTTNEPGYQGNIFAQGAGCEAGLFQGSYDLPYWYSPNNLIALELDQTGYLTTAAGQFTYSSVQLYQSLTNPCLPGQGGDNFGYWSPAKVSTSPINLNISSSGTSCPSGQTCTPNYVFGTSGDTYSVVVTYDGWNLGVCLYDVTLANGSCSSGMSGSGTYFQNTFSGVLIPSIVGGTTANLTLSSGVNIANLPALTVSSWSYVVNTPSGTPSYTAYNANSTTTTNGTTSSASPVFSVSPGTYSSAQTVSITTSTTPHNYICYTLSATALSAGSALYPNPTNGANTIPSWIASANFATGMDIEGSGSGAGLYFKWGGGTTGTTQPTWPSSGSVTDGTGTWTVDPYGGCAAGTRYISPITISSTSYLYAMAGPDNTQFLGQTNPTGLGPPSTLVAGTYTITGGSSAATPTFSPVAGTYTGTQLVTASTTTSGCGSHIYFDTNPTPVTNQTTLSVATSETVYAYVHGCPGYTDSSVGSASYVITSAAPAVIRGKIVLSGRMAAQ